MDTSDPHELRRAFGRFLTGVTVITCKDTDGTPRGFTANSFSSVSLDPPLLLACIAKSAESRVVFENASNFAINILSGKQEPVSRIFATKQADKFDLVPWHNGEQSSPILDDVVAWFECSRYKVVDAGDHIILIGEVNTYHHKDKTPLGYGSNGYFVPSTDDDTAETTDGEAMPLPDDK